MKKIVFVCATLIALSACGANPIESVDSGNTDVSIEKIGTVEGCNIYRVEDGYRRDFYTTICSSSSNTSQFIRAGKTTRLLQVDTVYR